MAVPIAWFNQMRQRQQPHNALTWRIIAVLSLSNFRSSREHHGILFLHKPVRPRTETLLLVVTRRSSAVRHGEFAALRLHGRDCD